MPSWVETPASTHKIWGLEGALQGFSGDSPDRHQPPTGECNSWAGSGLCWSRMQYLLACVWAGFVGRAGWARPQHLLVCEKDRMGAEQPKLEPMAPIWLG